MRAKLHPYDPASGLTRQTVSVLRLIRDEGPAARFSVGRGANLKTLKRRGLIAATKKGYLITEAGREALDRLPPD